MVLVVLLLFKNIIRGYRLLETSKSYYIIIILYTMTFLNAMFTPKINSANCIIALSIYSVRNI